MGTTLNKLEYVNTTKGQIKTALNQFGAGITDETTFRNYVDKINDIYDNWEKVTGEGTDITLTPTKKGKLQLIPKGNATQNGDPTPTTPIDVEVVTGNNEVVVRGNNLFNIADCQNNYTLGSDGLPTYNSAQTRIANLTPIIVEGMEKVTMTFTNYHNGAFMYSLLKADNTLITRVINNHSGTTITIGQAKYMYICFYDNATLDNVTDAMLIEGSTGTPYEPYKKQTQLISLGDIELCKIGNYEDIIFHAVNGDLYYDSLTEEQKSALTYGKWYKHNEVGKVTFNGTETWYIQITQDYTRFDTRNIPNLLHQASRQECYSNYFKFSNVSTIHEIGDMFAYWVNNGSIYLYPSSDITSIDEFEQWLSTHNTSVYYIFETPTDTEITNTALISQLDNLEKLQSYVDTTNITSSYETGNAQMILSASALKKGGN